MQNQINTSTQSKQSKNTINTHINKNLDKDIVSSTDNPNIDGNRNQNKNDNVNFDIVPEILNTTAELNEYLSSNPLEEKYVVPNNLIYTFIRINAKLPSLFEFFSYNNKTYLDLMARINDADVNEVIYLPRTLVVIQDLLIKKPLKLIGHPDTILYVRNGSIRVNFDLRYSDSHYKFSICECKIVYSNEISIKELLKDEAMSDEEEISINKIPESKTFNNSKQATTQQSTKDTTQPLPVQSQTSALFVVESHSKLELQDCFLSSDYDCGKSYCVYSNFDNHRGKHSHKEHFNQSKTHTNPNNRSNSFLNLNRTKIYNYDSFNDLYYGEVHMESCFIAGFQTAIAAGPGSFLNISKCWITDAKGDGIVLQSPLDCNIVGTTIELSKKNGIYIKSKSRNYDLYNQKIQNMISIEGCEVNKNRLNGICLDGDLHTNLENLLPRNHKYVSYHENMPVNLHSNLLLSVSCSRVRYNGLNGVICKNISLKCVQILQSDIGINNWDNITFKNVKSGDEELLAKGVTCLGIICNRLFDSKNGHGISLLECSTVLIENNEVYHNKLCGLYCIGREKLRLVEKVEDENPDTKYPLILNQLSISKNGESGILLYDFFPDGVLIHDSKIFDNRLDGLAIIQRGDQVLANPYALSNTCTEVFSSCTSFLNKKEHIRPNVVKVSNCDIHNNGMSGIYMIKTPVIITDVVILDNKEFAVHIPEEQDKKQLAIVSDGQVDCTSGGGNLHGLIGGSYGEAKVIKREKICSTTGSLCFN